jgi:cytochrome c-type biogenesis protein CcmH
MITLWLLVALMIITTVLFVGLPLIKSQSGRKALRTNYDLTIYEDQLIEIDQDFERGIIAKNEVEAARLEIQRRILKAVEDDSSKKEINLTFSPYILVSISLFIVTGTLGLYSLKGSPELPNQPYAKRNISAEIEARKGRLDQQEVSELISRILVNLKTNPSDHRGWLLLGRTYMTLNDFKNALQAFRRAIKLTKKRPDIIGEYAEALIMAEDGKVSVQAKKLYTEILIADPLDPKARYYLGLAKAQDDNLKGAMQDWVDLGKLSAPNAPWMELVNKQIESIASELGINSTSIKPSSLAIELSARQVIKKPNISKNLLPGPSAEDVKAAEKMSSEDRQKMIESMVERLAERLKDNPNDLAGWNRLTKAYEVLGNKKKAEEARAHAETIEKNMPK